MVSRQSTGIYPCDSQTDRNKTIELAWTELKLPVHPPTDGIRLILTFFLKLIRRKFDNV